MALLAQNVTENPLCAPWNIIMKSLEDVSKIWCASRGKVVYEYHYYPYVYSRKKKHCHDCTRRLGGLLTGKPASQERNTLKKYFEIWSNLLPCHSKTGLLCLLHTWKKKFSYHNFYVQKHISCQTYSMIVHVQVIVISMSWLMVVALWPLHHDTKKTHKLHMVWSMII